jgi:hypothetical protein
MSREPTLEQVRMQIAALGYNETRAAWLDAIDTAIAALTASPQAAPEGGEPWANDDLYSGHPLPTLHDDPAINAEILIQALTARLDIARKALAAAAAMQVVEPKLQRIKLNAAWAMSETDPRRMMPRSIAYNAASPQVQGGEAVAEVIENRVGIEIAWSKPPSAGRPPPGTKLYASPQRAPGVSDATARDVLDRYLSNAPSGDHWPPERQRELRVVAMRDAINNALEAALASGPSGVDETTRSVVRKVMAENHRLRQALMFYAARDSWMGVTENAEARTLLVAAGRTSTMDGWAVAEEALAINVARLLAFLDEPDAAVPAAQDQGEGK